MKKWNSSFKKLRSLHPVPSFYGKWNVNKWKEWQIYFLGSKITWTVTAFSKSKRHLLLGRKAMTNLDSILKRRDTTALTKVHIVKAVVFPVIMYGWELDRKEGWAPKWCSWIVVLEKPLESPLDRNEIKPVNPKGTQPWIFFGRTDAEVEDLILWPPDAKRQLTRKDSDTGKDWRQQEKRAEEDEMVGWHHQLNWHHSEQTLGASGGQRSLACCSPRGCKELDPT